MSQPCQSCGTRCDDSAHFCPACGRPVTSEDAPTFEPAGEERTPPPLPHRRAARPRRLAGLALFGAWTSANLRSAFPKVLGD